MDAFRGDREKEHDQSGRPLDSVARTAYNLDPRSKPSPYQ